jgi:hypothetical protein
LERSVRKPELKRPLRRYGHRWQDNVKFYLKRRQGGMIASFTLNMEEVDSSEGQ